MSIFDFEEARIVDEVRRRRARRIAIQLPEGLKPHGARLAELLEELGCTVFLLADPCYGACDAALSEARELGVDLLIHFGHSPMMPSRDVDTLYVDCRMTCGVEEVVKKAIPLLKGERVGLCAILQHLWSLSEVASQLSEAGFKVYIANPARPTMKPGQVIGCDYTCAKRLVGRVDCFLFIGGGLMHPIGMRLSTGLPVVAADPLSEQAVDVEVEARKVLARRIHDVALASEAKVFGVVVGLKPGQHRPKLVEDVVEELRKAGRRPLLLACRELTPSLEAHFPGVEVFVSTPCPLIALFDREGFHKPVLTPVEAKLAVSGRWREGYVDPFEGF